MSRLLRLWPFGLFVLLCLTIASNIGVVLETAKVLTGQDVAIAVTFGLSLVGLSVLAVVGGLYGRSFIRGLAVASILGAAVFVMSLAEVLSLQNWFNAIVIRLVPARRLGIDPMLIVPI